jgi:hypothetical protein
VQFFVTSQGEYTTMFGFSFDFGELATPCGDCEPPAGQYALTSVGDAEFPPDGTPVPFMGGTYVACNHGSGIYGDCNEVARWYVLPPG